jgi:pyruvate/2-oxoglutarate/acetoin dehydrogenase E1 component
MRTNTAQREITYREAIREGLVQEMKADRSVIFMGEDVGRFGGMFGVTKSVQSEFPDRVFDTPISEAGFVGCAIGAAITGLRPVVELMFFDFCAVAFDQIVNHAAKLRFLTGGQVKIPLTIRSPYGASMRYGPQHSQALYSIFIHFPGLKVVIPSDPYSAKGLLAGAIRDDNPVLFLEHKAMYELRGAVPDEDYVIPVGEAALVKEGKDVTIVSCGLMLRRSMNAAAKLQAEGISAEVIDLMTVAPLDKAKIIDSVKRTHRLVVVDEDYPKCGLAEHIAALAAEEAFDYLDAPIKKVTPPDTQVPFSPVLEDAYLPSEETIAETVRNIVS